MQLALFALVLVLGVALASFAAGWIIHETADRCTNRLEPDDDRTQPIPPTTPPDVV